MKISKGASVSLEIHLIEVSKTTVCASSRRINVIGSQKQNSIKFSAAKPEEM